MTTREIIDLGNDPEMQEILDAGYAAIIKQGIPSYIEGKGCRYRSNGERCILGWFIPDDVYDSDMEGKGVEALLREFGEVVPAWFHDRVDLLTQMQSAHDGDSSLVKQGKDGLAKWTDTFRASIHFIASDLSLDDPSSWVAP
jgi:hypothetical protein